MIFFEIKLNDFFQFKNFELDLTIPRASKFSPILQQHSKYSNLKYKKFGILLGANASGKTTFGKAICIIQNFLKGRDVSNFDFAKVKESLESDFNKKIHWDLTFSVGNHLFNLVVDFTDKGVVYEKWKYVTLKNQYYNELKKELDDTTKILEKSDFESPKFSSYFLNSEEYDYFSGMISDCIGYLYSFSGDQNSIVTDLEEVHPDMLTKIMVSFDSSIKQVTNSKEVIGNKVIEFRNKHKEILLKNGKIVDEKSSVLSTGTKESIYLAYLIYRMSSTGYTTFYVDERMSHSHSEVEQQIIQIMITLIDRLDGQVFITSHNSDLLNMKFPNYNFMLFKKNRDGSITEMIQPEKLVKHNDRSLKNIVEQDVFSTAPQLDELINLHENFFEDEE